jgi:glycosyltransferase involved in cell wall biosynthesis
VRFLGQRADVPRLMAAADVYCQPNTVPEPFGVAFVEALYAGRPVVTSDCGGGAEVVCDAVGVRVPAGDAGAVAAALRGLLADPARRAALGAAGPARAQELCDPAGRLMDLAAAVRP